MVIFLSPTYSILLAAGWLTSYACVCFLPLRESQNVRRHCQTYCVFVTLKIPGHSASRNEFWGDTGQRSLKPIKPVRMGSLPKPHHSLSRRTRYFACGPPGNVVAGRLQQDDEWSHISAHSLTSVFTANPWHTTAKLEWGQANRGGFRQCRSAPQTLCYGIDRTSCIERNLHWRNIIVRTQW